MWRLAPNSPRGRNFEDLIDRIIEEVKESRQPRAVLGPLLVSNLAVVYAWTNELGLAFEELEPLTTTAAGIYYGNLKRDPYWEPLRKDPRFGAFTVCKAGLLSAKR